MRSSVWFVMMVVTSIAGCSREALQRNTYETLRQMEQNRCQSTAATPCPRTDDYDDYQQKRKELEQNR